MPKLVDILPISVAAMQSAQDTSAKVSSGFQCIDDCLDGGFREGDFTVISGIPGSGKTTLARMFTLNLAGKGIPSCWFSYEMTIRELWDSFEKMGADTSLISYVPIELEHESDWIFQHVDKAIKDYGVKAIFIDTLGDVSATEDRRKDAPNYAALLDFLCKDLRDYAIKTKTMIFVMAHAVKNTRSMTNETRNSDIANSNGIAAAATNIFHVWREPDSDNLSYVKIGKSRRDGTKQDWKFKFRFTDHKLLPEGRHLESELEDEWRRK